MLENLETYLQLGTVAVIFLFFIKQFFDYLKAKKNGSEKKDTEVENGLSKLILTQLELMNSNHLHTIQDRIETGNKDIVEAIHRDNTEIIKILSKIEGALNNNGK